MAMLGPFRSFVTMLGLPTVFSSNFLSPQSLRGNAGPSRAIAVMLGHTMYIFSSDTWVSHSFTDDPLILSMTISLPPYPIEFLPLTLIFTFSIESS
jgi:hypothetical protein